MNELEKKAATHPDRLDNGGDSARQFNALNVAVHRASTLVFDSTEAFLSRKDLLFDGFSYGLYGTPTTRALEERVAEIENGRRSILVPSGLAALTHPMLSMLGQGDHVLVADCVYGPLRVFCATTLERLGISVTFFRADAHSIAALLTDRTKLVVMESPGSLTMEIQEIGAVCDEAHAVGALVMMDNTWGFGSSDMFGHGVDLVSTALSKYACGHSDICMGSVTVKDEDLYRKLKRCIAGLGCGVSSDDAYLVLRGLSTLEVRLAEHARRGLELTRWLRTRPEVRAIMNPADPDDRWHERFRRYFSRGNGLLSVVLETRDMRAIARMLDGFNHFRIGASWGGTTSLVALAELSAVRSVERPPQGSFVIRFHMGLEEPVDVLFADLEAGFARLGEPALAATRNG